jgi:hypothetical protein
MRRSGGRAYAARRRGPLSAPTRETEAATSKEMTGPFPKHHGQVPSV